MHSNYVNISYIKKKHKYINRASVAQHRRVQGEVLCNETEKASGVTQAEDLIKVWLAVRVIYSTVLSKSCAHTTTLVVTQVLSRHQG